MSYEIADVITPGHEQAFKVGSRTPATSLASLAAVHLALLNDPITASVATVNADGIAQLTPNWLEHDGTHVFLNSVRGRLKDRNLRVRPHVTIMLVNTKNPYHWITIYGEITRVVEEDHATDGHLATDSINRLSKKYLGTTPYPLRDPKGEIRVLYTVAIHRIVTFGPVGG